MHSTARVYLDFNATTPVRPEALEAMLPYFTGEFGNPSSRDHAYGWAAAEAVELAREQVARLVGASASEIVFTSGATEAANLALFGLHAGEKGTPDHIVSCTTEHRAVLEPLEALSRQGVQVCLLPVDRQGQVSLEELERALTPSTGLLCFMLANNETGVLHPIREIAEIAARRGALLLCDATQALGKIPIRLNEAGVDFALFSSHKVYGPKGAGALYVRGGRSRWLKPLLYGGGQERSLRPGTLNVPAIVGFGAACALAAAELTQEAARLQALRGRMERELLRLDGCTIRGADGPRLPNTVNASFRGIDGIQLLRAVRGIAVSRGSACSSNTEEPSHVLTAMGLDREEALASIRISMGRTTTAAEVDLALSAIYRAVTQLRTAHG